MADQPGVWGIDVGQCALKAIRLALIDDQITATAFDYVEHPKILSQPDADPDQLTREALEKFLSRNQLRGDSVAISIPGQSGLARFVKLPPVEEKKITDIVRFEAKQQIPFPLDEVVWDYQKISSGVVTDGFAMETEIGLFAIKRDMVNRSLQHFKDVNVEVNIVQMAPLALCNFVSYDLLNAGNPALALAAGEEAKEGDGGVAVPTPVEKGGKKRCVVALDIGADNSNLVITDAERIIWQRPIPVGGNRFTRDLTKELKLTFAKAEHLKRNATKSPDLKKILAALKPGLNEFVGEVQRSLGYFTNTHREAQIEYMIGLGNAFRLPGLKDFLSNKLQIDVRKLQKLERLSGDNVITAPSFTQNVLSFAVAYGLALQGLEMTRLRTNLLPQDIQFERMVRAKKPWAVAAAAALLAGVGFMTAGYAMEYRAFNARSVQDAMVEGDKVVKLASSKQSAYSSKEEAVKKDVSAVENMIAGQEERLNWVVLNRFINDCVPVPAVRVDGKVKAVNGNDVVLVDRDGKEVSSSQLPGAVTMLAGKSLLVSGEKPKPGTNVTFLFQEDKGAQKYWQDAKAQIAYLKFWESQAGGKNADQPDDQGAENLIQVNVEGIFALYAPNLKTYFQNVKDTCGDKNLGGMSEKDKKTPPEGAGWVIELRGYTYHKGSDNFLIDTLVNNLQTKPIKKAEPAKDGKPAEGKTEDKEKGGKVEDAKKPAEPSQPVVEPKKTAEPSKLPVDPKKTTEPGKSPTPKGAKPAETPKTQADNKPPAPPAKPAGDGKAAEANKAGEEAGKAAGAAKKPETAEQEELWSKIVAEKVSHVILYSYEPVKNPSAGSFKLISGSVLGGLVGGGTGAPTGAGRPSLGGGAPSLGGAPAGGNRGGGSGWQGLLSPGSGAPADAGTKGAPGMIDRRPNEAGKPPDNVEKTEKAGLTRTEFIVLFIWKEPTPSKVGSGGPATGAGQPGKFAAPNAPGGTPPMNR